MQSVEMALSCKKLWKVFGDQQQEQLLRSQRAGVIPASELSQSIADAGGIVACADVNLDIKPGEFFVLMGLSGSGKSTLMRCMSRLIEPTSGELELDGEDFLAASASQLREARRSKMGMVFQHFGLFPHMSVLDNVAYPLRVQKKNLKARREKALEMIQLVGLEGRELAYPHELSGGQKQRVGIARSLAVDPQLWFLDEPFSALDPLIRAQMQTELLRLQTLFKKTIVFVTHDFMEAVRLADRIAIMKDGQVVQVGSPEDIVLNPASDYVSEFVKEVPRTRIIKVEQLMQPLSGHESRTAGQGDSGLRADMTLEEALAVGAQNSVAMTVSDSQGAPIGVLTPESLVDVLHAGHSHGPVREVSRG